MMDMRLTPRQAKALPHTPLGPTVPASNTTSNTKRVAPSLQAHHDPQANIMLRLGQSLDAFEASQAAQVAQGLPTSLANNRYFAMMASDFLLNGSLEF